MKRWFLNEKLEFKKIYFKFMKNYNKMYEEMSNFKVDNNDFLMKNYNKIGPNS
jgi:hypothetical protein